jgi:hypothetical protein
MAQVMFQQKNIVTVCALLLKTNKFSTKPHQLRSQEVTNNQIHLMCSADKGENPVKICPQEVPHLLPIRPIISTPCNQINTILCFHEFNILQNKLKKMIAHFWFTCHIMGFDEVWLYFMIRNNWGSTTP